MSTQKIMITKEIARLKSEHSAKMMDISVRIRAQIQEYGEKPCDYLTWQREDLAYNTGGYNTLVKLEKLLENF